MVTLLDLPDELLLAILRRAAPQTRAVSWLAIGATTCRRMRPLWDDDALWRPVLARAVGASAAEAAPAHACTPCKQLVRFLLSATVDITVAVLSDEAVSACLFDGVRVALPSLDLCMVRRYQIPLTHAATPALLALRAVGTFCRPLFNAHVWLADLSRPYASLRLIHAAGTRAPLYPENNLWWSPRLAAAGLEATIAVRLMVANAQGARAFIAGSPLLKSEADPLCVPRCVADIAQMTPLGTPLAATWYEPGSRAALCHVAGCTCR
ncbi:hypothetical protein pdul_cds_877 [Pandoravirus dulcis]|uniref:F-box domain-containing protein n=1 Tax=Pandoravirus dulcis TaxID=1349409 RepID=S4VRU2_9VIRU|nr:hypothetical protein pdul_cds_877 [Pandoravirus dulcis]AGO83098.1 hypothetical protein pdul_cds_877 [Pandoravirus dulcis]